MKKQFQLKSTVLQCGFRMSICGLLVNGMFLQAQEFQTVAIKVPPGVPAGGTNYIFQTGGPIEAGFVFNGFDVGSVLLKTCDVDQDGKATLAEVKEVASACFKLWDTNDDGYLNQAELAAAALKELFPAPRSGGGVGIHAIGAAPGSASPYVIRGAAAPGSSNLLIATPVSSEELPTPDSQLAKHIFAAADSNKDGLLSLQEISDFLDQNFSQWDQDSNGSLDRHEFALAFGQLALPDCAATAPVLSR
jgi:Ca2+-binding EF-hand superfamily protein